MHRAAEHLRARDGIETATDIFRSIRSRQALAEGVQKLVGDPARAVEILGAVVNDGVAERIDAGARAGRRSCSTARRSRIRSFPHARIRTPLIVKLDAKDGIEVSAEWFGPDRIRHRDRRHDARVSTSRGALSSDHGALDAVAVLRKMTDVMERTIEVAEDAGVALSINLTGGVFVNQSAAFSDFHGTGANPAANAALTDSAFVASRFRVVQHRMHV